MYICFKAQMGAFNLGHAFKLFFLHTQIIVKQCNVALHLGGSWIVSRITVAWIIPRIWNWFNVFKVSGLLKDCYKFSAGSSDLFSLLSFYRYNTSLQHLFERRTKMVNGLANNSTELDNSNCDATVVLLKKGTCFSGSIANLHGTL